MVGLLAWTSKGLPRFWLGLDGLEYRIAGEAGLERESAAAHRVGWSFISLYTLAFISTSLLFLAPLLVTLALKVNSLVGIERAPSSLAVVTGIGALLAMLGNPFFGKLNDRTSSRLGMRRPWMVIGLAGGLLGILIVALAPNIPVRPRRMVHRPAALQRPARRPGGGAAGPGPGRATRAGLRIPGPLRAQSASLEEAYMELSQHHLDYGTITTAVAVLFAPPIVGALVSNELVATVLDYLPAGLSAVLVSGTGERYSPEAAALLLGAWAIASLAVGSITLHRRDP